MGNSIVRDPDIPDLEVKCRDDLKTYARDHRLSEILAENNPYKYNCNNPRPTFETSKSNFDNDVLIDAEYIALEYVRRKSRWGRSTTWTDTKCQALKSSQRLPEVRDILQEDGIPITFDTVEDIVNQGMTDVEEEDELAPVTDELAVAVGNGNDNAVAGVINSIRRKNAHQQQQELEKLQKNTVPSSALKAQLGNPALQSSPGNPLYFAIKPKDLSPARPRPAFHRRIRYKPARRPALEALRDKKGMAGRTRGADSSQMANLLSPGIGGGGGHRKRKKRTRRKKKRKKGKKTKRRR